MRIKRMDIVTDNERIAIRCILQGSQDFSQNDVKRFKEILKENQVIGTFDVIGDSTFETIDTFKSFAQINRVMNDLYYDLWNQKNILKITFQKINGRTIAIVDFYPVIFISNGSLSFESNMPVTYFPNQNKDILRLGTQTDKYIEYRIQYSKTDSILLMTPRQIKFEYLNELQKDTVGNVADKSPDNLENKPFKKEIYSDKSFWIFLFSALGGIASIFTILAFFKKRK